MIEASAKPGNQLHILALAGSLRSGSYNRALLRAAQELAPEGMEIHLYQELASIPPYNADVEAVGDPTPVVEFKTAIRAADALLIATPEYNHGVPGVLKNALDWASRPHRHSPLDGKPAALLGAAAGRGGTMQAQAQLRQAFVYTGTCTLAQPEFSLTHAADHFDRDGRLIDQETRSALKELLEAVAEWTHLVQQGGRYHALHAALTPAETELRSAS
jgi:chromate reductase